MSEHSPGPWRESERRRGEIVDANGEMVCADCGCGGFVNEEALRLAIAAPELLEALKALVEQIRGVEDANCQGLADTEAALALIARIEGGG